MATIHSYLTFNGNCGEAMAFYRECLGGELTMQTVSQSPGGDKIPLLLRDRILQATLRTDSLVLYASDLNDQLTFGNSVSVLLNCESLDEANILYKKLSAGGTQSHQPQHNHFNVLVGGLLDKFGVNWLIRVGKNLQ